MIIETFQFGPIATTSVLFACPKTLHAAVVDVPFEAASFLDRRLEELNLQLEFILLTHSHWDHIGEVALLKKRRKEAKLLVHEEDAANLIQPGSDGLPCPISFEGVIPDGYLVDGQELVLGTLRVKVIHTPGHTPGGVCFFLEKEGVLISGDTLFQGAIGNLRFKTGRPHLMPGSLKKLLSLPHQTRVIPGHGDETKIGNELHIIRSN